MKYEQRATRLYYTTLVTGTFASMLIIVALVLAVISALKYLFFPAVAEAQWVYQQPVQQPIYVQQTPQYTTIPRPWYYPNRETLPEYWERSYAVDQYNAQVRREQILETLRREERKASREMETSK